MATKKKKAKVSKKPSKKAAPKRKPARAAKKKKAPRAKPKAPAAEPATMTVVAVFDENATIQVPARDVVGDIEEAMALGRLEEEP